MSESNVFYGQCQIYTTEEGQVCPLCQKPIEPNKGHYCEIRKERKEANDVR